MTKYGARKTVVDNVTFDSIAEARYYSQLKLMKLGKQILDFELQPRFLIVDPYICPSTGKKVRGVEYVADFKVKLLDGSTEIVDVKGVRTEAYKIKKKLFESRYHQAIKEIGGPEPRRKPRVSKAKKRLVKRGKCA